MKILVLYCFCRENKVVQYFLDHAVFESDQVQFLFVRNNDDFENYDQFWSQHHFSNVNLLLRKNFGHDFGGWNDALFIDSNSLKDRIIRGCYGGKSPLYQNYDTFVFLNDTAYGPFVPKYTNENWLDLFIAKLSKDIAMTCVSVNCMGSSENNFKYFYDEIESFYGFKPKDKCHVQSFAFAVKYETLMLLLNHGLFMFNNERLYKVAKNKPRLIQNYEIGMSAILRHHQKSIFSFRYDQGLLKYNDNFGTDNVWCEGEQFVYETMFVKTSKFMKHFDIPRYLKSIYVK